MSGNEERYVADAFASNFIAPLGPQLDAFEVAVREYLDADVHCVGLSSGSAALHLALRIAGVGPGDEVWVSSMTFAGGVFPINYLGASPRFFDIGPINWTMNTELIEQELALASSERRLPKAIVPTDLYGQSVDLYALEQLAAEYGVRVIVDSAESLGASFKNGRKAGTGGDAAILSFNGNKIITSSGGGMLITRHREWANHARFLATQARDPAPHYEHSTYGYNYRLSNICAAIGLGQMEVLEDRVKRRRAIYSKYHHELFRHGVDFMPEPGDQVSSRWLTVLTFNPDILGISNQDVRIRLFEAGIESRPLWKPMHTQPVYAGTPYHGYGFDERLFQNGLCLPSGSDMSDSDQNEVISIIQDVLRNA